MWKCGSTWILHNIALSYCLKSHLEKAKIFFAQFFAIYLHFFFFLAIKKKIQVFPLHIFLVHKYEQINRIMVIVLFVLYKKMNLFEARDLLLKCWLCFMLISLKTIAYMWKCKEPIRLQPSALWAAHLSILRSLNETSSKITGSLKLISQQYSSWTQSPVWTKSVLSFSFRP